VRASRISIALAALLSCAAACAHLVVTVSGDPAETVREAQERAAEEPDWPEVGADLVRAYVAAGRPDEALAELDRIVKLPGLAGDKTHVRMAGAEILLARGDLDAAIAELRAAAFNILETANPIPTDYEAWAEVQAEIRRVGHCGQPQFENPLAEQVVQQLGWRYLCLSENPVADRAHFVQAYQAMSERQRHSARRLQVVTEFIATLKAADRPLLTGGEEEVA